MVALITPVEPLSLKPEFSFFSFSRTHKIGLANLPFHFNPRHPWRLVKSCVSHQEIDMVKMKDGVYSQKPKKVVVLWDLDNKPPRGPPYKAALSLKSLAQKFGYVADVSAYANRHAFIHLPQWVAEERRERRHLDVLERKGLSTPSQPYICSVCGRKCKTHLDLKKHFQQLHERERQKKLNRMRSLKGKKRQRFKERFVDGNEKYNDAARVLLTPKIGYGLANELKRAGVFVKTVQDKPQAADWALKRQILHSMSSGVDWIVLVSDDSDFCEILRKAKDANMGTVVVGDQDRSLGRYADVWVPWINVENGEIKDSDLELRSKEWSEIDEDHSGSFTTTQLDDGRLTISAFSEGEEEYYEDEDVVEDSDWMRRRWNPERDAIVDERLDDNLSESEDEILWL